MRVLLTFLALSGVVGAAWSAPASQYTFSFTVQVDGTPPVALDVSLPPGTNRAIQATPQISVEIETPASVDDTSTTIVKLIDSSSGEPIVLHTARRIGGITEVRSFGYTVCHGLVTFHSPPSAAIGECKKASR